MQKQLSFRKENILPEKGCEMKAVCPACGKTVAVRKLFLQRERTCKKLCSHFNYCPECGRWVCDGCFVIYDEQGNDVSLCKDCAKRLSESGYDKNQLGGKK